jgi:Spy/CpxP family protein refolding chaperone
MRTRLIALSLLTLSLAAPAAFADGHYDRDGDGWHREWHDEGHERDRDGWRHEWHGRQEQRERYEAIRQREVSIERDRERLEHELREGDWRAADELRQRIWWEERDLERYR